MPVTRKFNLLNLDGNDKNTTIGITCTLNHDVAVRLSYKNLQSSRLWRAREKSKAKENNKANRSDFLHYSILHSIANEGKIRCPFVLVFGVQKFYPNLTGLRW
jgi:hypothetical protein